MFLLSTAMIRIAIVQVEKKKDKSRTFPTAKEVLRRMHNARQLTISFVFCTFAIVDGKQRKETSISDDNTIFI